MTASSADYEPFAPAEQDRATRLDREAAAELAQTLRAVADPTRLQILSLLDLAEDGEATVTELTDWLGLRQPTVSHHLRLLHDEGVVQREQRGKYVWYRISAERREDIRDLLR